MDKFVSIFPHQSKQRRVQAQNRLINQAVDVGNLVDLHHAAAPEPFARLTKISRGVIDVCGLFAKLAIDFPNEFRDELKIS